MAYLPVTICCSRPLLSMCDMWISNKETASPTVYWFSCCKWRWAHLPWNWLSIPGDERSANDLKSSREGDSIPENACYMDGSTRRSQVSSLLSWYHSPPKLSGLRQEKIIAVNGQNDTCLCVTSWAMATGYFPNYWAVNQDLTLLTAQLQVKNVVYWENLFV
jgi:hypothetical protein